MITEKVLQPTGAFAMMLYQFIGFIFIGAGLLWSMVNPSGWAVLFVLLGIGNVIALGGYAVVAPNQAHV